MWKNIQLDCGTQKLLQKICFGIGIRSHNPLIMSLPITINKVFRPHQKFSPKISFWSGHFLLKFDCCNTIWFDLAVDVSLKPLLCPYINKKYVVFDSKLRL